MIDRNEAIEIARNYAKQHGISFFAEVRVDFEKGWWWRRRAVWRVLTRTSFRGGASGFVIDANSGDVIDHGWGRR